MKLFISYSLLLAVLILSGCAMRVIPREVERVDQEIKGNRGVVRGKVTGIKETVRKRTKTVYDVEIELGPSVETRQKDATLYGNRGYIEKRKIPEKKSRPVKERHRIAPSETIAYPETPQVVFQESKEQDKRYAKEKGEEILRKREIAEKPEKIYVVKKGDTLQKISEKMYGTTKKWKKIYEANRDILESPDMIKPGQKLVIPLD